LLPRVLAMVCVLFILCVAVKTAAGGSYTPDFRREGFHFQFLLSAAAADLDSDARDELILAGRNYVDREVCAEILGWEAGSLVLEWRSPNLLEPESSLLALPLHRPDGSDLVLLTRSRYRIFRRLGEGYAQIVEGPMPFPPEEGTNADLDGDGTDELILSATLRNTKSGREKNLRVLSFSDGAFFPFISSDPVGNVRSMAAGDLDQDGRAEVVVELGVATKPGEFQIFRLAEGSLRRLAAQKVPLQGAAYGLAIGRRFSETKTSLFAASLAGRIVCFSWAEKGFVAVGPQLSFRGSPVSLAAGDLDGDGREELILVNNPATLLIFVSKEEISP